jgi:hypothetical protein
VGRNERCCFRTALQEVLEKNTVVDLRFNVNDGVRLAEVRLKVSYPMNGFHRQRWIVLNDAQ